MYLSKVMFACRDLGNLEERGLLLWKHSHCSTWLTDVFFLANTSEFVLTCPVPRVSLVSLLSLCNAHSPLLQKLWNMFVARVYVDSLIHLVSNFYRIRWPCFFIQLQSKLSHGNIREFCSPSCAKESIGEPSPTYRWWSHQCQAVVKRGFSSLCCCPTGKERCPTILAFKYCERWRTKNTNDAPFNFL